MKDSFKLVGNQESFDGWHQCYCRFSRTPNCRMVFVICLSPQAEPEATLPAPYWLSRLTCIDENFIQKTGTQRVAAELELVLVAPDTSPRSSGVPGDPDGAWDFGLGTDFYPNAMQEPWAMYYRVHDYVVHELPALIGAHFPVSRWRDISGHSMGGYGALIYALHSPGRYLPLSASALIYHLSDCPWGQRAFSRYLGKDPAAWREWDACVLLEGAFKHLPILIDRGGHDDFLAIQFKPEVPRSAVDKAGHPLELRLQLDYDHSYHFITSFIEDHLRRHAQILNG